jgi:hypothetical protein
MMLKSGAVKFVFALVLLACATSANAATVTYSGSTVGDPTWNRPIEDGSTLSPIGTAVPYSVQAFQVNSSGSYNFLSLQTGFDGFLFLYSPTFSSTNPLASFVIANDDFPDIGIFGFTSVLTAGVSYFLVMTGFANDDAGSFINAITGNGTISLDDGSDVPLPAALPLFAAALAGVAYLGRRKKRAPAAG